MVIIIQEQYPILIKMMILCQIFALEIIMEIIIHLILDM